MKKRPTRPAYNPADIEKKWQKKWASSKIYRSKESDSKSKFYVLDMFPYPSGEGLHVGHPKGYIATDIVSRMKRMQGMNVLHPMGFDAFGLPAENYAIKTKTNPQISVAKNVAHYKEQLELLGFDYDWSREVNTTDPAYYRWTQWIFLQLWKKGLAFESNEPVNWCPTDKTVLANEDVENGRCERCGTLVEKKPMRQWVLRITDYADRLLKDLDATGGIPLVTLREGKGSVVEGAPFVERIAAVCIIKHWSEDKYLCVDWKASGWKGFVIGGIEKGEDAATAGVREIQEETGYKNVRFVREIGKVQAKFYQMVKKVNRHAHFTAAYFELKDGERADITQEEKDLQDIVWLTPAEVQKFVTHEDMKYLWDLYTGMKKQVIASLLEWPESIKEAQRNWIGRSEGAQINFELTFKKNPKDNERRGPNGEKAHITVFTTRADTLFGATYVVLAPEHLWVRLATDDTHDVLENKAEVKAYLEQTARRSEIERTDDTKEKTGVELKGVKAINPATGEEIPMYVADYVLGDYGTGAVMAVPSHDERDADFAKVYKLPVKDIIPGNKEEITAKFGTKVVKYKLRDWVFSRQRYWGEPIPLIHCEKCGVVAVPEKELPVKLPKVEFYEPTGTGESPLAAIDSWVNVKCPQCKGKAKRETNTMPQWAGSSWYYLRYMDPDNKKAFVDPKIERYWSPVDLYVGGAEHATRHLIYARFWHKFLYDIGAVSGIEPFKKLQSVGLIMAEDGRKMSKRFGNVVNPDEIVATYGADTLRIYEMFMGPFDQAIAWSTQSMVGSRRFIERVWKLADKVGVDAVSKDTDRLLHKTIKKVSDDIQNLRFNTAISTLMIALNELEKNENISRSTAETYIKLLAPFAPHVTEELWTDLGNKKSIHVSEWPRYDAALAADTEATIVLQINGKTRGSFMAAIGTGKSELEKLAQATPEAKKWIEGKEVKRIIAVPDKLVNIVV